MNQNENNVKSQNTTAQKIVSRVTLAIIVAIVGYWLLPNKPSPAEPVITQTSADQPPPTVYTNASPQALASATQYLADLDNAMTQGLQILKANNLQDLSAHSQHFKTLRETGQAQFGNSVFEPLGHCASAGIFVNSWWQAQVSAARQGGEETAPDAIQSHLNEFQTQQSQCLKSAAPTAKLNHQSPKKITS